MRRSLSSAGSALLAVSAITFALVAPCDGVLVEKEVSFRGTIGSPGVFGPGNEVLIPPSDFPPDTQGAVGPTHIVEINKKEVRMYHKSTGQLGYVALLDDFWNSILPSPVEGVAREDGQNKSFDPRILYDESMERWIVVSVASEHRFNENNRLLVAVSHTSDPQGTWSGNAFVSDPFSNDSSLPLSQRYWADFPRLGVSKDVFTVATTLFDLENDVNAGLQNIQSFSKDAVVNSDSVQVAYAQYQLTDSQAPLFAQPVVDLSLLTPSGGLLNFAPDVPGLGPLKPVGEALIGLGNLGSPARVDIVGGVIQTPVMLTPTTSGSYQATFPSRGVTPGSPIPINVGPHTDPIFEGNVIFKNGFYWGVRDKYSISSDSSVIEWFRINPYDNTMVSGLIADHNPDASERMHYYYPSIAVNDKGYAFIGFSGSAEDEYVGAYGVAGETVNGVPSFGDVFTVKAGEAPYNRPDRLGRNRWGDYSATVVDPSNDNTFWTFQEYALLNQGTFGDVIENSYATHVAAYQVFRPMASLDRNTFTLVEVKQFSDVDEGEFMFAGDLSALVIGGEERMVEGSVVRVPIGFGGPIELAYQGQAMNYVVGSTGYLAGEAQPDALDSLGVPPVIRFDPDTGEYFAEFFNPYDFFVHVDGVQLYTNNDMNNLNLFGFAKPTGELATGIPTSFILWPGQTYRLSFGDFEMNREAYLLAIGAVSRFDDTGDTYRVATAATFAVPEPATLCLLLVSSAALVRRPGRALRHAPGN